jgi:cyclin-dependent kinase regulatory subunit CKS1
MELILPKINTYSDRYCDNEYEYRHVILGSESYSRLPRGRLLTENEWRELGVQMSKGWIHYMIHKPDPNVLIFRRRLHPTTTQ